MPRRILILAPWESAVRRRETRGGLCSMPVYRILVETDERDVPVDGGGHWRPITNDTVTDDAVHQPSDDWSDLEAAITATVVTARVRGWHLRVIDRDSRDILWDTLTDGIGSSG